MGRSRGGAPRRSVPARRPAPPPARAHPAQPPAPVQSSGGGGMMSGIGSTIAQGLAFGTGSAVAHRAVDGIMGPRTVEHVNAPAETASAPAPSFGGADACGSHMKAFQDCVASNGSDISRCQFYVDMLNQCRQSPNAPVLI